MSTTVPETESFFISRWIAPPGSSSCHMSMKPFLTRCSRDTKMDRFSYLFGPYRSMMSIWPAPILLIFSHTASTVFSSSSS